MAAKHLMIAINWFGPYPTLDAARSAAKGDYDDGLYMCFGRCAGQRRPHAQYIGLSKTLHTRLNDSHHALGRVVRERQIWLGEIVTAEPSGRKLKVTKATLDYAEGDKSRASRLLNIGRKTLYRKLEQYEREE